MIYIDLIIILNMLIDILLLFCVAIILRRQTTFKRLLISSLVGSLTIFILFLNVNNFFIFLVKIIVSFLMVIIAFKFRNLKYTIRNMFYLYTSSIVLGGFLYLLNIEFSYKHNGLVYYNNGLSVNFIVLLIISPLIIYIYIKQARNLKNNYSNYYNVDIYLKDGRVLPMTAFLDTGNHLTDPYKNRPIILVNKKYLQFNYRENNILLVPYDTINNHGLLKCIIPDQIYIDKVGIKTNFLVGISEEEIKIDGVDCILHTKLMEE